MSLATGNKLHVFNWTEFPIGDCVIDRVEEMARSDNQKIMTNGYSILKWLPEFPILDDDEDEN